MSSFRFRVLSMDGGGIYGYMTALLLEELCNQNADFLTPARPINLYAGTSAGALNALLLAASNDPRGFVMTGQLKAFWQETGLFSNSANPVDAFWSLFGLTAWLGSQDFKQVLDNYFQSKTLADIGTNGHVLVTAWDWTGSGTNPTWRPIIYSDRIQTQSSLKLADIAYGAAAPAPLRAVFNGIGDGGYFAPNPSLYAYAFALASAQNNTNFIPPVPLADDDPKDPEADPPVPPGSGGSPPPGTPPSLPGNFTDFTQATSQNVAILSVGTANASPYFFLENFNLGAWPFSVIPTNPSLGNWYAPFIQLSIDAPTESEVLLSQQLLGDYYHRLDPPLLKPPVAPPVLVGTSLARFQLWQQYLLQIQDAAAATPDAAAAILGAKNFIESAEWTG